MIEWYSEESAWDPFGGSNTGEASVDLRLGESSNSVEKSYAEAQHKARVPKSSSSSTSCSGASRRKRVYHKSAENVKCSVDGCSFDLRNCREYHRRHRVCQLHSKTSAVLVKGQEQRFCQQCSRFQSLDEFDGYKRSCRRRLEGHNKRRRKPRPPPLYFSADSTGPRLLQFGNPSADPCLSMWAAVSPKAGAQPATYNRDPPILPKMDQQTLLRPFGNIQHLQDKQVPMLQPNGNGVCGMSMYRHHPVSGMATAPLAEASRDSYQKMTSDSALYLLSALQAQSSEFSMVESSINCSFQSQPPLEHVQFDDDAEKCSCSRSMKNESIVSRLGLDANPTNLYYNGTLQMGAELIENGGSSLTFPFSGRS